MSIYPQTPGNRTPGIMIPVTRLARSVPPPVPTVHVPNTPEALYLTQGADRDLTATWTAPSVDGAHSAATGFNLRFSLTGTHTWTTRSGVSVPYVLSDLAAGTAFDVQVQAVNVAGSSDWSATSTLTTASEATAPNAPSITTVAPPPDGTTSKLLVAWDAPAVDASHSEATGYNLRYRSSGTGNWTTVSDARSPYTITGLSGAAAIDVEVQAKDVSAATGEWSALATGTTWGATVVPGFWTPAATQVHGSSVAPNGGVQLTATPAPTGVTAAAFAWSHSASVLPTTNLITAGADGQPDGWGQWFDAPATSGTYYLWSLAQGTGGVTIGALVSSAITVT